MARGFNLRQSNADRKSARIGFTTGVWDCYHQGHKNCLKFCYDRCDYLIVGVCSDHLTKQKKGEGRPHEGYLIRLGHVERSGYADKIICLTDMDYTRYLQIADVWFRGADQNLALPEWYLNTVRVPRTPGVSSTLEIEKLTS